MANHEKMVEAISSLCPNALFVLTGDKLQWHDTDKTEPTQAEIDAEIIRLDAEYDSQAYARKRKAEYDALNQFELISDDTKNGTTTHIDAIDAIKKKYPKG